MKTKSINDFNAQLTLYSQDVSNFPSVECHWRELGSVEDVHEFALNTDRNEAQGASRVPNR